MPKTAKAKKKVSKPKTKVVSKPKKTVASPAKKVPIKISKTYVPKETEKYMCEKHKVFFRMKLQEWKKTRHDVILVCKWTEKNRRKL